MGDPRRGSGRSHWRQQSSQIDPACAEDKFAPARAELAFRGSPSLRQGDGGPDVTILRKINPHTAAMTKRQPQVTHPACFLGATICTCVRLVMGAASSRGGQAGRSAHRAPFFVVV